MKKIIGLSLIALFTGAIGVAVFATTHETHAEEGRGACAMSGCRCTQYTRDASKLGGWCYCGHMDFNHK